MEYQVTWTIDIEADNPLEAAREALDSITREGSIAHVFDVTHDGGTVQIDLNAQDRLEYLRGEIRAGHISYGELAELQTLADHIQPGDVELAEPAGINEQEFMKRGAS